MKIYLWLKYFIMLLWFLITATLTFVIFTRWNQPILFSKPDIIILDVYISFILFINSSILFAGIILLRKKGLLVVSILFAAFLLFQIYFFRAFQEAFFIYFGIALIGVIFAIILGFLFKKFLGQEHNVLKLILLFIVPLILFIILALHINKYQKPSDQDCLSLKADGQADCFERYAKDSKNPAWCFPISDTANNIQQNCLLDLQKISINFSECDNLPNDPNKGYPSYNWKMLCKEFVTAKSGNIEYCESQNYVSSQDCLTRIIATIQSINEGFLGNKNAGIINCSSLKNTDNRKICENATNYMLGSAVKITSPVGGEQWQIGKTYDITWQSQGIEKVYLTLVGYDDSDNIVYGLPLENNISISANLGRISWTVPKEILSTYNAIQLLKRSKIFIGSSMVASPNNSAEGISDFSDNYFSIIN